MSAGDAGSALGRALGKSATAWGVTLDIANVHSTRWVSATFVGARHVVRGSAADTAAVAAWLKLVGEENLSVRGQIVVDLAIDEVLRAEGNAAITFAALTVEDQ